LSPPPHTILYPKLFSQKAPAPPFPPTLILSYLKTYTLEFLGEWTDGRINGYGTLTYQDGDKYIGQWIDGKMNGQGTYIYADGDKYEGEWRDDKRHGKGTVTYRGQDGSIVEQYQGEWSEGKMHGYGRYVYADGGVYEGQWVDGKMSLRGAYVFPNGSYNSCLKSSSYFFLPPSPLRTHAYPPTPPARAHSLPPSTLKATSTTVSGAMT